MTVESIAWGLARECGMTLNRCSRASRAFWMARARTMAAIIQECEA